MKMKNAFLFLGLLALAFTLTYCGDSGGGGGSTPTGKAGFSKGIITAKGSIFVNGVEYDTSGSSIKMDDTENHTEAELKVGMVVEIKGDIHDDGETGDGAEIEYDDILEGPISDITSTPRTLPYILKVLGQNVTVDSDTKFEPSTSNINTLLNDDIVEVSGFPDNSGAIHATYIELKVPATSVNASTPIEVKGTVANLGGSTFTIGGLTVDYSAGPQLKDIPNDTLADGQFVEVKSIFGQFNSGTSTLTLRASDSIEYEIELEPAENELAEVEGYVMNLNLGAKTFTVSGISVDASAATLPGTLANGSKVEVHGTYSGGVLMATTVELKNTW